MGRIDEAWKRYSNTTSGPAVAPTPEPHVRSAALAQYRVEQPKPELTDTLRPATPALVSGEIRSDPSPRVVAPLPHPVAPTAPAPIAAPIAAIGRPPHAATAELRTATAYPPPGRRPAASTRTTDAPLEPSARIAAALQEAHASSGCRAVMVTGTDSREDHTEVAISLARDLSLLLPRVLLVDVDADAATLQTSFDMRVDAGGAEWLRARGTLPMYEVTPHLFVLTAERLVPPGGFTSDRIGAVLDNCSMFDFVVLCGPPVSSLPDAAQLARRVGAVVYVLSARAPFSVNERGMTQVGRTSIMGTVLRGVPGEKPDTHPTHTV